MKTVLLAGGVGTRLAEETQVVPKPLVEIGGRPILWHIMKIYGAAGFEEFVVALGYKGAVIKRFFFDLQLLGGSYTLDLKTGETTQHDGPPEQWKVHLVETGLNTQTGGRVKRLKDWIGNETFMLTYGDGVADVDLKALLAFHKSHGRLATVTAVRPPARFGGIALDDAGKVETFIEKPQIGEGWINGGFMVLEPGIIDYIGGDEDSLEHSALEQLSEEGQLMAYRHEGFWQCMDTRRDRQILEDLWANGQAPWRKR